ncbi:MAG: ferritin family protein [Rhodospirillales bacterium]|nr:ferritin family protein [Rhodospirillales bacterium]MCW8861808.1 ferritin family protein [Rhodospirillales bacterium]MCW9001109.1 ferritin family protein [Rhodospirillales bacterium]MCW9039265.1 ferritin family protein [Rhodospirillales bacterium]
MSEGSKERGDTVAINTLEEFLAHALALELEAAEGYQEVGENLVLHNNPDAGALFKQLAEYGRLHVAEVRELSKGRTLPHIAPWDFKWPGEESPETPQADKIHYLMTPHHALRMAYDVETSARDFYAQVAANTTNDEVRVMAQEFADEEAGHMVLLEEWMTRFPEPDEHWDFDPDPPMMHE